MRLMNVTRPLVIIGLLCLVCFSGAVILSADAPSDDVEFSISDIPFDQLTNHDSNADFQTYADVHVQVSSPETLVFLLSHRDINVKSILLE